MSIARHHAEWLSLVPVSGPFLSLPVLVKAFPQGLDAHEPEHAQVLRMAFEEWNEGTVAGDAGRVAGNETRHASRTTRHDPHATHHAWIRFVLTRTLDFDPALLLEGQAIPQTLQAEMPEHHEFLRPNYVLVAPNAPPATHHAPPAAPPDTHHAPRLLIQTYPRSQSLTTYVAGSRWKASPDTRMTELLHATGVRLGLVTNGEHWMLVDAPKGETTGYASWYASLWLEEKITLRAFRSLLSQTRFFGVADDQTIEALLAESSSNQQEVTDRLGLQVRRAVEVLIHSLDKADQDNDRALLADVPESVLYESALTVMMRLVFLFCAEERELIPSKPFPVYERNYSVSAIINQLEDLAQQHGEELLERRNDAWSRLLTAFRVVYGGLQHEDVYIPAYGGKLFDPDRFPFLEGRKTGTTWRVTGEAWRVAGDGWREGQEKTGENQGETDDGDALSGTGGLAGGDGSGRTVLSADEGISEGRTVRDDESDSSRRSLDPGEHRGGPGTGTHEGVSELPEHRKGLIDRTGDASVAESASGFGASGKDRTTSGSDRPNQPHDLRSPQSPRKTPVANAIPPSPATHHAPRFAEAKPLPVNNRTVLHLLKSLQYLEMRASNSGGAIERRRLSFRALDIEQIGHVYEGLLDHTAKRATEPILGLVGAKNKEPEIALATLEKVAGDGWCVEGEEPKPTAAFLKYLNEQTGRSESALLRALSPPATRPDSRATHHAPPATSSLRTACQTEELWHRVKPFAGLIRNDTFGYPVVIPTGSVYVTSGTDRRSSGTHYTPKSLTEPIVQYTLEPLVYVGPAEGKPKNEWQLKSAAELLQLKICDMACGSGAFLVQACRYMSERVLEAWDAAECVAREAWRVAGEAAAIPTTHHAPPTTPFGLPSTGQTNESLIPEDPQERKTYAMRLIAQRCLYGVDINPLAVEMAKLSLWLLTMAKDKPFEFLDHNIRCGDSLVGLHNLDQLRHFNLKPDSKEAVLFGGPFEEAVEDAISLRLKLEEMSANTIDDIREQEKLLREANDNIARLRCAADLLVAAEFWGENARDKQERVRHAAVVSGHHVEQGPTEEFEEKAEQERRGQKMFHWPLEFPEVIVKRGGFDAFVGNPPFMGGLKLESEVGREYRSFLVEHIAHGVKGIRGTADLCAYFFRRCGQVIRSNGLLGLLATNTIAQGDSHEVGLSQLTKQGFAICRAHKSMAWPGDATLEVAQVWLMRGEWHGLFWLGDGQSDGISTHLTESSDNVGEPYPLSVNLNQCFVGSYVLGMGFTMSSGDAEVLIAHDQKNAEVLFPYINGSEFNSSPSQEAGRWIINFFDWPLEKAREFPDCMEIIEKKVKPERDKLIGRNEMSTRRGTAWWRYAGEAKNLYLAVASLDKVLVRSRVSNINSIGFLPTRIVFSDQIVVFAFDDFPHFAVLQSAFHTAWLEAYSSTLRTDVRYTPGNSYDTFPFCMTFHSLENVASSYYTLRQHIMRERGRGLTKIYNRFHDPAESSGDIQKLRALHVEMDKAVAGAYGWDDLDLNQGFHETTQGLRFTISEPTRREVLRRLLMLNHERYAEEVKQGLHAKKGGAGRVVGGGKDKAVAGDENGGVPATKRRASKKPAKSTNSDAHAVAEERSLFSMDDDDVPQVASGEQREESEVKEAVTDNSDAETETPTHHAPRATHHAPPDTDVVMAAFRQATRGRGSMERDELLINVATTLGYQRLGAKIEETLRGHLRAAIRRRIIEAAGATLVRAGTASMADFTLEELRDVFVSVMRKNTRYEREGVIHAVAKHLGFARVTDNSREAIKSAINSGIRQGLLSYAGSEIWREG